MSSSGFASSSTRSASFPFLDRSQPIVHAQKLGRIQRRGLQRLHGRESRGHESLQFLVQAETRKNVNAGRRVRSREKRNSGAMHRVHDFQFFFHEALPGREIVGVEVVHDLLGEAFPRHIFPICGSVLGAGVMDEIGLIDQDCRHAPTPASGTARCGSSPAARRAPPREPDRTWKGTGSQSSGPFRNSSSSGELPSKIPIRCSKLFCPAFEASEARTESGT